MAINPTSNLPNNRWQWTTKDLLVGVTLLSVYLAMLAYLGVHCFTFWVCTVVSLLVTAAFVVSLPRRKYKLPAAAAMGGIVLFANPMLMFFSLVIFVNCIFHFIFLLTAKRRQGPTGFKQTLFVSLSLVLISFSIGIPFGIPQYLSFLEAKKDFRAQDLGPRLSYERTDNLDSPFDPGADFEIAGSDWETFEYLQGNAKDADQRIMGREWAIKGIHESYVESFIKAPGFGVGRFLLPSPQKAYLPPLQDIPLTLEELSRFKNDSRSPRYYVNVFGSVSSFDVFHLMGLDDFTRPETYGLMIEPRVTRGFQSHGFHLSPQLEYEAFLLESGVVLENLQLVSVNRFDQPRVYVLDHLPRMDQLTGDDVPTRELTEFERRALEQFRRGKPIVTEANSDGFRMVGPIRAVATCIECHAVDRGDILGAFTYHFRNIKESE